MDSPCGSSTESALLNTPVLIYSLFREGPSDRKKVSSTYNLRVPTGDCILFPFSGPQLMFFRAKTRPENAVGMLGTEVGALFQLTTT
jgi:hypothetical protein